MPDIFDEAQCCVCNNSNPTQFKVLYQKEKFSVIECNQCSFTFIPPYFRKQITYENYPYVFLRNKNLFEALGLQ